MQVLLLVYIKLEEVLLIHLMQLIRKIKEWNSMKKLENGLFIISKKKPKKYLVSVIKNLLKISKKNMVINMILAIFLVKKMILKI